MFDTDLMEYRVTEDQFNSLCDARHLLGVLEDINTTSPDSKTVTINRESLSAVLSVVREKMEQGIPELNIER